ncbi:MAG TPA: CBS domain-containing protein [Planctomycetota bacterium]|nr:CBS domain-containing protein [Planctomycetota bacterium]
MKARNLMTKDVASCGPDDPMATAARIMWERDCGIVPVVDGDGRPVGVVTDRDLCMAALTRNEPLSRMAVRDAMARDLVTCREDDDEERVHGAMRKRQVRRLPVLGDDGRLVGMISLNDLILAAAGKGGAERRQHELARTAAEISRHREVAAAV